ncbi:hypothetical protein ACRCQJ_12605 [Pseudomonas aeruginosa]|jgi:hypothetical protein|nr:hypothetical protein [Pseudomonas aeruginosa]OZB32751.1 MAG: hypothetical protein B7X51_05885 [Pseudomonas sp. 34-62-33]MCV4065278.1 hypothetical protein [Pseudomonas aeruginosa]MCV4078777.1 hypothetical protein [Pseudomonas aeruginosa]MCV4181344.1 hypothetical protein [Pseudomonas aeruginosa]MCV4221563.1 hypothetical protein [Pseudomonas aeruginosa]
MLKKFPFAALLCAVALASGCTTHLSEGQKRELDAYEQKGLKAEEKSVGTAAVLGIFPMAGYFYTGHPALAVTTLPLYPFLGPLWMPYDTAQSAKNRNYYATKEFVEREKRKALTEIDHKMEDKQLTYEQHVREQRLIEAKYSPY